MTISDHVGSFGVGREWGERGDIMEREWGESGERVGREWERVGRKGGKFEQIRVEKEWGDCGERVWREWGDGQADRRTSGHADKWTNGQADRQTAGQNARNLNLLLHHPVHNLHADVILEQPLMDVDMRQC